jgi:predicted Holliday junction resolvase-like endonuclease
VLFDTMRRPDAITQLQADARIYGRCPACDEEFPLRRALLFYADAPLPDAARARLEARRADLRARAAALRERRRRASEGATQKAIDVNVGMILERVAPVCDGFGGVPRDCRPLFDPIDYVVFNGLALHGEVTSITFLDVKTGGGALTPRQRHIRTAIEAGKVEWQEYSVEGRP